VRNLMHRNPRSILGSRLAALLWYRFFKEVRLHFDNAGAFNVYIATLSPLPLYCCAVSRNSHTSLQHTPTLPRLFPEPHNAIPRQLYILLGTSTSSRYRVRNAGTHLESTPF
jgi:hypothetical protein